MQSLIAQMQGDVSLPLLASPAQYRPNTWDLLAHADKRAYWLGLFRRHWPLMLEESVRNAVLLGQDQAAAMLCAHTARSMFEAYLDKITNTPNCHGPLNILSICLRREAILRQAGIDDPYQTAKQRENKLALKVLPALLSQLDTLPKDQQMLTLTEGIFAGNIFDLGATETAALFKKGQSVDFHQVRSQLKPRPWLIDDLDLWLNHRPYQRVLMFVDNAGSDIVLGMIPFARAFLMQGIDVILAANTYPSLNDITCDELKKMLQTIMHWDQPLAQAHAEGRLQIVASGNGAPLIDLSKLSSELVEAVNVKPVDLVVLEGMGRALESNFKAKFVCDVLKIAMVKDKGVADSLGGSVYDLAFRFEPKPTSPNK